jgi:hypothetical protein
VAFERAQIKEETPGMEVDPDMQGLHIFPGPKDFLLQPDDMLFCIAMSAPSLYHVIKLIERSANHRASVVHSWSKASNGGSRASRRPRQSTATTGTLKNSLHSQGTFSVYSEISLERSTMQGSPSAIPRGCEEVGARSKSISFRHARTSSDDASSKQKKQLQNELRKRSPAWSGHIVICGMPLLQSRRGGGRGLVTELIEALLRASKVGPRHLGETKVTIVDANAEAELAEVCVLEDVLAEAAESGHLRAVSADSRHQDSLVKYAFIRSAFAVITLPQFAETALEVSTKRNLSDDNMFKKIVDTGAVLRTEVARLVLRNRPQHQNSILPGLLYIV